MKARHTQGQPHSLDVSEVQTKEFIIPMPEICVINARLWQNQSSTWLPASQTVGYSCTAERRRFSMDTSRPLAPKNLTLPLFDFPTQRFLHSSTVNLRAVCTKFLI